MEDQLDPPSDIDVTIPPHRTGQRFEQARRRLDAIGDERPEEPPRDMTRR